jgi:hypothetical protein
MTENIIVPGFRLGKLPKKSDPRTLQLKKYLAPIPVPVSEDLSGEVNPWPMFGNNAYGDCTCAAIGHMTQLFAAMAGIDNAIVEPVDADILQLYYDINNGGTPFPAGASQDQGANILDVIKLWMQKTIKGVAPFAFAEVDISNLDEVKVAISLFGGLDIGIQLPLVAQGQTVWDDVYSPGNANTWPGTWGGHSVSVVGFDATGLTVVTWGSLKKMTWAFWNSCVDEAYAILPTDWKLRPDGFDFATLEQDLTELQQVQ